MGFQLVVPPSRCQRQSKMFKGYVRCLLGCSLLHTVHWQAWVRQGVRCRLQVRRDVTVSDVHGPAQSRKPAKAGLTKAEPTEAVRTALGSLRLRLSIL